MGVKRVSKATHGGVADVYLSPALFRIVATNLIHNGEGATKSRTKVGRYESSRNVGVSSQMIPKSPRGGGN